MPKPLPDRAEVLVKHENLCISFHEQANGLVCKIPLGDIKGFVLQEEDSDSSMEEAPSDEETKEVGPEDEDMAEAGMRERPAVLVALAVTGPYFSSLSARNSYKPFTVSLPVLTPLEGTTPVNV